MKPRFPILALLASAVLLVLSIVLLPVYECGGGSIVRAMVPPACTEAVGLILAFLAVRRLLGWRQLAACLLMLLHGFLFIAVLWHIYSDLAASRLTTRSSERRLAVGSFVYSTSCVASLRR